MPFIPHTERDVKQMLETIGVSHTEQLFDEIPENLRIKHLPHIPDSLTEMKLTQLMKERASLDAGMICYIGAGAYEHHIPAAVWDVTSRGEFLTAYTPYQAEASQGTLQLLYEFQTMMASLMALEVSNASLYEGGSALAEAVLMAVRANKHSQSHRILIPRTIHPFYREVVQTIVQKHEIEILEIPYDTTKGVLSEHTLKPYESQDITAIVISQPNFFGQLEEVDTLTNWAHAKNALVIGVVNPLAMALLKPPGEWGEKGADIACGEGQPLGVPLASGGPYYGFICCKKEFVRNMPGRIVGRTVDKEGKHGFVLTLQAREQHIRRAKATSNICTNQGLLVTASTIYMSLMGPVGLRNVAIASYQGLLSLQHKIATIPGVKIRFKGSHFHEMVLEFDMPVSNVLSAFAKYKIQAGFSLEDNYPELKNCLLVCVTETKSESDIARYVECLTRIVSNPFEVRQTKICGE